MEKACGWAYLLFFHFCNSCSDSCWDANIFIACIEYTSYLEHHANAHL